MPDTFVILRQGEKQPVFGQEAPASGTLTISATPPPAATLYDSGGSAVIGFSHVTASGYDAGAQSAPRVWLNLDTSALPAGFYTLVFTFTAVGSDGITRIYEPGIEIEVQRQTD